MNDYKTLQWKRDKILRNLISTCWNLWYPKVPVKSWLVSSSCSELLLSLAEKRKKGPLGIVSIQSSFRPSCYILDIDLRVLFLPQVLGMKLRTQVCKYSTNTELYPQLPHITKFTCINLPNKVLFLANIGYSRDQATWAWPIRNFNHVFFTVQLDTEVYHDLASVSPGYQALVLPKVILHTWPKPKFWIVWDHREEYLLESFVS